jgi:N-acetylglucosaminyldiphosphoundecaprenol N-acetyl-beta-D-mannosaminyltransferase
MWKYLAEAERVGQVVFFYGSTEATLAKLRHAVLAQFPGLRIGGTYSPSFGNLTPEEDEMEVDIINAAQPHVVLVGLGCPKQEKWMAAHWSRVNAVMIGVGAAFDYHAGTLKRAPLWWQNHGLEWLYRLTSEPRRLFMRYMITNTLFIIGISKQLLSDKVAKLIRPSTVEQSNR